MVLPEASKPKMVDVEPVDNPKYCIVSAEETTISKPDVLFPANKTWFNVGIVVPVEPDNVIGRIPVAVLIHNKSSAVFKKNSPSKISVSVNDDNVVPVGVVGETPVISERFIINLLNSILSDIYYCF